MLADIVAYLYAVGTYWVVVVTTASPFVLDEFFKRIWPRFREWLEKTVSPKNRRRWEIVFMAAGFIVANFLAFEDEHQKRLADDATVASLTKQGQSQAMGEERTPIDPDTWPPLTGDQITSWVSALKTYGSHSVSVQWFEADTNATDFYRSIKKVGDKIGWSMGGYQPMDGVEPGLTISSRPDDQVALALRTLLKDYSGIDPKWAPANYDKGVVNIKVGERIAPPSSVPNMSTSQH
jgi:hypothetical protein